MKRATTVCRMFVYLCIGLFALNVQASETFEFNSYKDIEILFEKEGYTQETWEVGVREVPRLYLSTIPKKWKNKYAKEVTVQTKKRLFFRLLAPGVLRCNELIVEERSRLEKLAKAKVVTQEDQKWLMELAEKYGVVKEKSKTVDETLINELLIRVDIIPPSLAMAQGANESGWGTSRFAQAGNSLFGQWTWGGRGISSKGKQKGKGDYKVAAFDSPIDSIAAFMLNLNKGGAYKEMRAERAAIRQKGEQITGLALVKHMEKYSQRGKEYVQDLENLMRHNKLAPTDEAYLRAGENIELVPVSGQ